MRIPHASVIGSVSFALFAAACSSASTSSTMDGTSYNAGTSGGLPGPGSSSGSGAGDLGATPGGAQDIAYARRLIEEGQIPPSSSLTVEGLVSEHDIPAEGPACTTLMCARPAIAWAPSFETGKNERWIQIGLTSGLANFTRPPLDAVVVIDASSSMSIDIRETTEAVARIADKLRPDDRLGVITYQDAAKVLVPFGPVGDRTAIRQTLQTVNANGGSNLERGLGDGFDMARSAGADPKRLRRVMLLSCGYPDASTRGPGRFVDIVESGARDRIGFSFYGVLLGFDAQLANAMSQPRGGSYSYAGTPEQVEKLFDTDFDFMVTPIAYDLAFDLSLASELDLARMYGIPGDAAGKPKTSFSVKTAFVSRRRGAIIARASEKQGATVSASGAVRLSYEAETAVSDEPRADVTTPIAAPPVGENVSYSGVGVRKAVFLVNEIEGMKKAIDQWMAGQRDEARTTLDGLAAHLAAEQQAMADAALLPEVQLVQKLRANMSP